MTNPLLDLDLVAAARAVARRDVDPVELTQAYLSQIEQVDDEIGAYITVAAERALDDARRAAEAIARGAALGPLAGVPLAVKDLFDTAGLRTTYGSGRHRDHVPDRDSTVVRRLREAGAVVLGKHATHELAWGGTTNNQFYGPTHNPHDHTRIPGGSSGGSAASVIARSSLASVGSDTCGSVRIPAALCGCVGMKPTYGRVSLAGAMPLARSLDHAGPITRTVADAALLLRVIAGSDPLDLRTLDDAVPDWSRLLAEPPAPQRLARVGRLRGWFEAVLDDEVRGGVDRAARVLGDLGHEVVDVDVPESDVVTAVFTRLAAEAGALHQQDFRRDPAGFGREISIILARDLPSPREIAQAEAVLAAAAAVLHGALEPCDLLLSATVPCVAPPIGASRVVVGGQEMHIERVLTRLTAPFDVTGLPALSLPVPPADRAGPSTGARLPVAVQLAGRRRDESTVLLVGRDLETALREGDGA